MIDLKIKASHDVILHPENMWHTIVECQVDEDNFADMISSLNTEQQRMVLDAMDKSVVNEQYKRKNGAQGQYNQAWHDPKEKPEQGRKVLAETEYGTHICGPNNEYWKELAVEMSIIRWAYISDLLPEGGKE